MENEDRIKRQMDFIIEQQARFEELHAKMEASHTQLEAALARQQARFEKWSAEMEVRMTNLTDALLSLTNIVEKHENQIAELQADRVDLHALGKETDRRLNALINVVERMINRPNL